MALESYLDLDKILDPKRVWRIMRDTWDKRAWHRKFSERVFREYKGDWHGGGSGDVFQRDVRRPINALQQLADLYVLSLCGHSLQAKLTPNEESLRGASMQEEAEINILSRQIEWARWDRLWVQNAVLTGSSWMYVGCKEGPDSLRADGELMDDGRPFLFVKQHDDVMEDRFARHESEAQWRSCRFECPVWAALELGLDEATVMRLAGPGDTQEMPSSHHDREDAPRADDDELFKQIELWDVFIHRGDRVLRGTMGYAGGPVWVDPLDENDHPENGPLIKLSLGDTCGDTIPVSPAMKAMELHLLSSKMASKLAQSFLSAKVTHLYEGDQEDVVREIKSQRAFEEYVRTNNAKAFATLDSSNVLKGLFDSFQMVQSWLNNQTPNLQLSRGIEGMAKTLGEAQMLQSNAQGELAFARDECQERRAVVLRLLAAHNRNARRRQEGTYTWQSAAGPIQQYFDPTQREGGIEDMLYEMQAVSSPIKDPNIESRRFIEAMSVLLTTLPQVAMTGGDVSALVDAFAEILDQPAIHRIYPTNMIQVAQQRLMQFATQQQAKQAATAMHPGAGGPNPRNAVSGRMGNFAAMRSA